jgi:hypothetical protein
MHVLLVEPVCYSQYQPLGLEPNFFDMPRNIHCLELPANAGGYRLHDVHLQCLQIAEFKLRFTL